MFFSHQRSKEEEEFGNEKHGRNPKCNYKTEIKKSCNMEQGEDSERKLVCRTLKRLFEQCPGGPMQEIERTETSGAPEFSSPRSDMGMFNEFHKGFRDHELMDPHMLVDPLQIFERFFGMDGPFSSFAGPPDHRHRVPSNQRPGGFDR